MNLGMFKLFIQNITWDISPAFSCGISYFHSRHRIPNFKNPTDFSEIVYSEMISGKVKEYAPYVDKIKVRKYLEEWGYEEYLPQLYGVWKKGEDIDFSILPNKFALKTNNFCGGHLFCHDKRTFNEDEAREHMNIELSRISNIKRESQYNQIEPMIFAEELIEDINNVMPIDYKFHCCDGRVRGCLVAIERGTERGVHLVFYDNNWKKCDDFLQGPEKSDRNIHKPEHFEEMKMIAEDIAQKFKQVRVDFYDINGKLYLGELTFTPHGGIMSYYTDKALLYLGHQK